MLFRNLSPINPSGLWIPHAFWLTAIPRSSYFKVERAVMVSWTPVNFLVPCLFLKYDSLPQMCQIMLFPFSILSPALENLQSPTGLIWSLVSDGWMVPFILLLIHLYHGSKWFIHRLAGGVNSHCIMTLLWTWQVQSSHHVGARCLLESVIWGSRCFEAETRM